MNRLPYEDARPEHARRPDLGAQNELAPHGFIGVSEVVRKLARQIRAIAAAESTVLIRGETGTGKGLVARLVHQLSGRHQRPWVHLDCSAMAPTLVESELFGHERGAFTGAAGRRIGRFEQAGEGTIFLDEVGEMHASVQVKLLRVLQDRELERIGGMETLSIDARVVAATNRDLERAVRDGSFRSDLYYRLNVLELRIPPLRTRPEDIEPLARRRLWELAPSREGTGPAVADSFYAALADHDWPGNVRELHNLLLRATILSGDRPLDGARARALMNDFERLPSDGATTSESIPRHLTHCVAARYGDEILAALRATRWNVTRAARQLDIPRSTLRYRMSRLGLAGLLQE